MYPWVTDTWNTVKGACLHRCSYCYMKNWGPQKVMRFDEKELKTDLGSGNFIFVGSSNDLFSERLPVEWVEKTLRHCSQHPGNKYLFQTKNPSRVEAFYDKLPQESVICTTIETNRFYYEHMGQSPSPECRADSMCRIASHGLKTYVTIEPIMDFDMDQLVFLIETCLPEQVNIGADSGGNNLPEPTFEKISELIGILSGFTKVVIKKNLKRLMQ